MYCTQCGAQLKENDLFCPQCGTRTASDTLQHSADTVQKLPSWCMWALAFLPAMCYLLEMAGLSLPVAYIIEGIVALVLIAIDKYKCESAGYTIGVWAYISALLFIPLYMFIRPARTDKDFTPAIVYVIALAASIIIPLI